jgi:hypothetical protein
MKVVFTVLVGVSEHGSVIRKCNLIALPECNSIGCLYQSIVQDVVVRGSSMGSLAAGGGFSPIGGT